MSAIESSDDLSFNWVMLASTPFAYDQQGWGVEFGLKQPNLSSDVLQTFDGYAFCLAITPS